MDYTSLMKMDVFFVVTTTAVFLLTIGLLVICYYVARILSDIAEITSTVRREAKNIAEDIGVVRAEVHEGVAELKEGISEGVAAARSYSRAFAGASIIKALSQLFQAFAEEKQQSKRTGTRKRKGE